MLKICSAMLTTLALCQAMKMQNVVKLIWFVNLHHFEVEFVVRVSQNMSRARFTPVV